MTRPEDFLEGFAPAPFPDRRRREADLFFADLMAGGRRSLAPRAWEQAPAAQPLELGPLTEAEWAQVLAWLAREEIDPGAPLGADADRNAARVAAAIFCSRNVFRMERGDPLLCVVSDVTERDPRVRALIPLVTARGPIVLWHRVPQADRVRRVMELLVRTHRYPVNGAAGLVGNLVAESGVIPSRVEGSAADTPLRAPAFDGGARAFTPDEIMSRDPARRIGPRLPGVGLAQWTSPARRAALFQHRFRSVQLGARVLFDLEAQVDFLVAELRASFAGVERVLTNPTVSVNDASDEVVYNFEIPGAILSGGRKLPRSAPAVQAVFTARRALSSRALETFGGAAAARPEWYVENEPGPVRYLVERGRIGRGFVRRPEDPSRIHAAQDIPGPRGAEVYAALDGLVIHARRKRGYGNLVILRHAAPDDVTTAYAHLDAIRVNEGETVRAGQLIGHMGDTAEGPDGSRGRVRAGMGVHLHFSVQRVPPGWTNEQIARAYSSRHEERTDIRIEPRPWLESKGIALFREHEPRPSRAAPAAEVVLSG